MSNPSNQRLGRLPAMIGESRLQRFPLLQELQVVLTGPLALKPFSNHALHELFLAHPLSRFERLHNLILFTLQLHEHPGILGAWP